ncbi:hypothetical protein HMPREF1546_03641 [Oscillibacter sp. KLE 1745]|nr:hypothetical protein HMPREF1546_03641 [Oscillibacter sp. KLE 1745]
MLARPPAAVLAELSAVLYPVYRLTRRGGCRTLGSRRERPDSIMCREGRPLLGKWTVLPVYDPSVFCLFPGAS